MNPTSSVAASLPSEIRKDIGIQVLSRTVPISRLAEAHQGVIEAKLQRSAISRYLGQEASVFRLFL